MTTDELKDYYAALLILQYRGKTKADATIKAIIDGAIADQIVAAVRDGYDIETAVGEQLDILGKYVGARRAIPGVVVTRDNMAFVPYADASPGSYKGLALYSQSATVDWYFKRYLDEVPPTYSLTDDELRRLINFKAAVQSSDFSLASLDTILDDFFGATVKLTDNKDMTIKYHHDLSDTDTLFFVVNNSGSLPRPAGVQVSVEES